MSNVIVRITMLIAILLSSATSWGAQIRAFVPPFAVTGAQNRDELKGVLQTLLSSRLSGGDVIAVENSAGADITISGSYVAFGKVFSLDAVAKNSAGSVLSRAFIQGDSQEELITAVGKLAKMLTDDLSKLTIPAAARQPPAVQAPLQEKKAAADIVRTDQSSGGSPDIVRAQSIERSSGSNWVSQRITGAKNGIAEGRTLENGEREIFVTGKNSLSYYRLGKDLKLVTEIPVSAQKKILTVDTADLDGDGVPEIYLTVMDGEYLSSQVWVPGKNSLKMIAENLQYFFRGMTVNGKEKRIVAQERGLDGEYYGPVYELVKTGTKFTVKNPIKLPEFANIFNFNRITDALGKNLTICFNPDGHLLVYSPEREQLWKSSDKFGGSDSYFSRSTGPGASTAITLSKHIFLDQRIVVTGTGEIIVPQNGGFFAIGDNRSYSKSAVVAFAWNGSSLEERWRTRQSQNYLADFGYDEAAKELILLEVVQTEGLISKGASAIYLKNTE
jgi:FG-GAP-like repeat